MKIVTLFVLICFVFFNSGLTFATDKVNCPWLGKYENYLDLFIKDGV